MPGLFFSSGIDRDFEKDLERMNRKLNSFSKNTTKQGKIINDQFKTIATTIGSTVSVLALGAAGKELLNFSKDLETALTEVSTISVEVAENFDVYKDSIVALSTESATAASELTDAFYDIVSAGYDGAQGLELLTAAEKASTAGFVEVSTAADGLTTVLNAWGKEAAEAGAVSDIFFKTVEKGKTTFPELGSNIAQVAPVAASLGVSFEEVSAAVATLTKSGTPTAQAFTQIRASLLAVTEALGDGWSENLTYQEALAKVREEAGGSVNELRNMLGRVEAVNAVLGLTGQNAETAAEDLNAMTDSLGATTEAAEKVAATTSQQIAILKNNILAALEPLGDEANQRLGDLIARLNEAFKSGQVEKYAKIVLQLIKAFIAYKASIIALNQVRKVQAALVTANIKALRITAQTGKAVSGANVLMAKSFKAVSTAIASNPIGLIVTGLTLALPLLKRAAESTDTYTRAINDFNKNINEQTGELDDNFEALRDAEKGTDEYREAIENINSEYGDYIDNLDAEKSSLQDIEQAYRDATDGLIDYNLEKVKAELTSQSLQKQIALEKDLLEAINVGLTSAIDDDKLRGQFQRFVNGYIQSIKELERDPTIDDLSSKFEELGIEISKGRLNVVSQGILDFANQLQDASKDYDEALEDFNAFKEGYLGVAEELGDGVEFEGITVPQSQTISKEDVQKTLEANRKAAIKALEIENQERINIITDQYGREEELDEEFQEKLLENRLAYLQAYKALTVDELEKLQIEEAIIGAEVELAELQSDDTLNQLLQDYQTYQEQRLAIQDEYNEKINLLRQEGYEANAVEAEKALQDELDKLDASILAANDRFQDYVDNILPGIAEEGVAALNEELGVLEAQIKIAGFDPELVLDYKNRIKAVKAEIEKLNKPVEDTNKKFENTIDVMNDVNTLIAELVDNFGGLDEETKNIATGVAETASGILNLASSVNAVGDAVTDLEKASAILTAISAAIQIISAIDEAINNAREQRIQNQVTELQQINAINVALLEQNRLYEEGNSFFAEDRWGTALRGLETYNQALEYQQAALNEIAQSTGERDASDDVGILKYSNLLFIAASEYRKEAEQTQIDNIQQEAQGYATEIERALGSIAVKTEDKSKFANFFGVADGYESLLQLYPELIDENEQLNTTILQTIIDTENLSEADKERLTNLIELTEQAEESYAAFGDYISDIFGSVGDDITDAFQTMYEEGTDAMESLEESFSDMIESFVNDAIEYAFLQPIIDQLNETTAALGEDYARGTITVDELQENIISTLGDFYSSINDIQPEILEAYENADRLAEEAGFSSAFDGDDDDTSTSGTIDESITEETGTEIVGRLGAIMLTNQNISNNTDDLLDYAISHLTVLNEIKDYTSHLPDIAEYTRRTADALE